MTLDLLAFERLPGDSAPWHTRGPWTPRNALVIGAFWMMRELELSALEARHVTVFMGKSPRARVHLPASKTDPEALGVEWARGCRCPRVVWVLCPAAGPRVRRQGLLRGLC